jgi:hypothetical protein
VAVSRYDAGYNNSIQRKGAALAAGWPDDNFNSRVYRYWTGQVVFFPGGGVFDAVGVYLAYGYDGWGSLVTGVNSVTVCAAP